MSARARKLAAVEARLEVAEMRLRNLFGFTAMMALAAPGGCFFCRREDGHDQACDFHSGYWNDPGSTIWCLEGLGLPDAWEEGAVCDCCGGEYPDHVGWCESAWCQFVSSGGMALLGSETPAAPESVSP